MAQDSWMLQVLESSPAVGLGLGLGLGTLVGLWWLGGLEEDEESDQINEQLDETINFDGIETQIEFYKGEILKLEKQREQSKSNSELLSEIRIILEEIRSIHPNEINEKINT